MTKKTFLVGIFISVPADIHAGIKDALRKLSEGDFEFAHLHKMGVFAFLNTEKSAHQIHADISKFATNDDRQLIMEVGRDWQTFGLNKAAFWLQNHLQK